MKISRCTLRAVAAIIAFVSGSTALYAQGVTTGAISGTVTNAQGEGIQGAQVVAVNRTNGSRAGTLTNSDGRYHISSLETGGPYTVSARRIGVSAEGLEQLVCFAR